MTVLTFVAAESNRAEDPIAPKVDAFLSELRSQVLALVSSELGGAGCREDFERSLPAVSNEANCSVLRLAIESLDAADEQLISDGHVYHCGPQTPTTMMSSFGLVPYERRRYRSRGCASIAPADDRFGIVNGFWSPLVAHHGLRALAPVGDCAEMFGELGGMSPSATALNHLVETVGAVLFFTLSRQK